jgi:hypothetical protein
MTARGRRSIGGMRCAPLDARASSAPKATSGTRYARLAQPLSNILWVAAGA